jgi:adenylate kinase
MTNIVFCWKPRADAKGTQAEFFKEKKYKCNAPVNRRYFSIQYKKCYRWKISQTFMDRDELVPDDVTIKMLQSEVEQKSTIQLVLFDGFSTNYNTSFGCFFGI